MISDENKILSFIFFSALLLRLVCLIPFYGGDLNIVDEQHYSAIAVTLVDHGIYGMNEEQPTAIRPPLYPFLISFVYKATNMFAPDHIRAIQMIISLVSGIFLYRIFKKLFDHKSAYFGLILFLFYPSLLFFNYLVLTETIFIFLLILFFYFVMLSLEHGKAVFVIAAGFCIGLTSLTRSITYPMAIPLAALICFLSLKKYRLKAFLNMALFLLIFFITLIPWSVRNYRLLDAFIPVDTMGGLNLYMGNYEHTPLHNSWASVEVKGEKAWYRGHESELKGMNEAQKQKWAIQKAKEYVMENPGITLHRSIVKFANFWGIERTIIAGIERGYFQAFTASDFRYLIYGIILLGYGVVILSGATGLCLKLFSAPASFHTVFFLMLLGFSGMHAVTFGHSRYHLPLIPILCGYAGWLMVNMKNLAREKKTLLGITGSLVLILFVTIWSYELFIGSADKIQAILK